MQKLIDAFKANPTEANRAKLAKYLSKHSMALCLATPEDFQFLKSNGFVF